MKLTEQQRTALAKRLADMYEKTGVAGIAVGLFQHQYEGLAIGAVFVLFSLFLTYRLERNK